MLAQLVYVSNRSESCTDQNVKEILETSVKNNKKKDVTGVLLYSNKKFIQYLEGDPKELLKLFDIIKLDSRHSNAMVISYSPITERSFPSWQMVGKMIGADYTFLSEVTEDERKTFNAILDGEQQNDTQVLQLLKKFI